MGTGVKPRQSSISPATSMTANVSPFAAMYADTMGVLSPQQQYQQQQQQGYRYPGQQVYYDQFGMPKQMPGGPIPGALPPEPDPGGGVPPPPTPGAPGPRRVGGVVPGHSPAPRVPTGRYPAAPAPPAGTSITPPMLPDINYTPPWLTTSGGGNAWYNPAIPGGSDNFPVPVPGQGS